MDEKRITYLESSVAFQEKTIEELSGVIHRQQQQIDDLGARLEKMLARLDSVEQSGDSAPANEVAIEERPPHY